MTAIDLDREAFLAERRKGVGGSDCAAICGLDPKTTPYQLWAEKVGKPIGGPGKLAAARRGRFMEDAILRRYAQELQPVSIEVQVHHEADGGWRRGNQDARAVCRDGVRRTVEAKSVNQHVFRNSWGQPWTDEVPDRALCQGLWYGNLDNADIVDFAVCVMPDDPDEVLGLSADEVLAISEFHIFQAPRNPRLESLIIERAHEFWHDHVLAGVPPPAEVADVDLLWASHTVGTSKDATEILTKLQRFDELRQIANASKKELEQLRAEILLFAQDSELLRFGDLPILSLREQPRAAHHVSASSARVLRFTAAWKKAARPTTPTN